MSTTMVYLVLCPKCRREHKIEAREFDLEPLCRWCGEALGEVERVDGFRPVGSRGDS